MWQLWQPSFSENPEEIRLAVLSSKLAVAISVVFVVVAGFMAAVLVACVILFVAAAVMDLFRYGVSGIPENSSNLPLHCGKRWIWGTFLFGEILYSNSSWPFS